MTRTASQQTAIEEIRSARQQEIEFKNFPSANRQKKAEVHYWDMFDFIIEPITERKMNIHKRGRK